MLNSSDGQDQCHVQPIAYMSGPPTRGVERRDDTPTACLVHPVCHTTTHHTTPPTRRHTRPYGKRAQSRLWHQVPRRKRIRRAGRPSLYRSPRGIPSPDCPQPPTLASPQKLPHTAQQAAAHQHRSQPTTRTILPKVGDRFGNKQVRHVRAPAVPAERDGDDVGGGNADAFAAQAAQSDPRAIPIEILGRPKDRSLSETL